VQGRTIDETLMIAQDVAFQIFQLQEKSPLSSSIEKNVFA
jgi:hypothetical protein